MRQIHTHAWYLAHDEEKSFAAIACTSLTDHEGPVGFFFARPGLLRF